MCAEFKKKRHSIYPKEADSAEETRTGTQNCMSGLHLELYNRVTGVCYGNTHGEKMSAKGGGWEDILGEA